MPNTLQHAGARAFLRHHGRCIYCDKLMWLSEPVQFAADHKFSAEQARRFHAERSISAHENGGGNMDSNIAVACRFCNLQLHSCTAELTPDQFPVHVRARIERGGWHP